MSKKLLSGSLMLGLSTLPAFAQDDIDFLTDMSLEELLEMEVSSVAKKPQDPAEAAAAVFVITDEDIRASGASTLYDALRMAPGVEVAEIDNRTAAVAIRGFNWQFSNKLLILVDGREVYSPSLPAILWVKQSVPLEDIARIEVVRGPSTAMWGSTAVNGVINIVTKHAVDTLYGKVTVQTSTDDRNRLYARYGFQIGDIGAARVYAQGRKIPSLVDEQGDHITDDSSINQIGFRLDIDPTAKDSLTFQGDFQQAELRYSSESFFNVDPISYELEDESDNWNVLGRWVHEFDDSNALTLQSYYSFEERNEFDGVIQAETFNIDFTHYFSAADRVDLVYGGSYRRGEDETFAGSGYYYTPETFNGDWSSVFAAADIDVIKDRLSIFLGVRAEDSPYTDWETQPTLRAIWTGEDDWSLWAAVSSSVRSPTRIETATRTRLDTILPNTPPFNLSPLPADVTINGTSDYGVEDVVAYELGFRREWPNGVNLDIAAYQQDYDHAVTIEMGAPALIYTTLPNDVVYPSSVEIPLYFVNNDSSGRLSGLEVALSAQPMDNWKSTLVGDVRDNDLDYRYLVDSYDDTLISYGDSPNWQASWRNDFTISPSLDMSIWLRHVSELDLRSAPAYTDLDIRASWRPNDRVELSVIGENLLEDERLELSSASYPYPEGYVSRRIQLKLGIQF